MQKGEDVVDDAVFLQQRLPGQGAQQKVHPHGKDEQQYHKAALVDLMFVQDHGQRIGQDEADHRAHQRQEDGKPQCFGMLMGEDGQHVFHGEAAASVCETIPEDHEQRDDDETHGPDQVRRGKPFFIQGSSPPVRLQIPVCS